jgi:hypothetical protein
VLMMMIGSYMLVLLSKYILARIFDSETGKMRDWSLERGAWRKGRPVRAFG